MNQSHEEQGNLTELVQNLEKQIERHRASTNSLEQNKAKLTTLLE